MGQNSGIIRAHKKRHSFTIIDKTALEDTRLSYKARGILAYLLSKPDNWTTNTQNLVNQSEKDGRTAILAGLKELEEYGYLTRKRHKDKAGQFYWEIVVFETPDDREAWEQDNLPVNPIVRFPADGKPVDGKTVDGKPGYILNKDSTNPEKEINKLANNDSFMNGKAEGARTSDLRDVDFLEEEESQEDQEEEFNGVSATNAPNTLNTSRGEENISQGDRCSAPRYKITESEVPQKGGIWQLPWEYRDKDGNREGYDALFQAWIYENEEVLKRLPRSGVEANIVQINRYLDYARMDFCRREKLADIWNDFVEAFNS